MTIDGTATEYQYNNEPINFKVKEGLSYTVTFSDLDGYKTPDPVSYTATAGNSRTISATYNATLLTIKFTGYTSKSATVKYGSTSKTVAHNGTILIPYDQSVSVSAPAVTDYKTPDTTTFTANSATKTITLAYKQVTLTIEFSGLSSTSLGSVTITGTNTSTQTVSHNGTAKVPYGTTITITPIDVDGYTAPDAISKSYTSNTTVIMEYQKILLAVRMLGGSNRVYTREEWSSADETFQGVYVTDGNHGFTVAPSGWYDPSSSIERSVWGADTLVDEGVDMDGIHIADITTTTDSSEALQDFNGTANTAAILCSQIRSEGTYFYGPPAAKFCSAYLIPSSTSNNIINGYEAYYHLPSLGECDLIYKNLDEINACLELGGGETIGTEELWSSTQKDAENAWLYNLMIGGPLSYGKSSGRCQVRPVVKNDPTFQTVDGHEGIAYLYSAPISWINFYMISYSGTSDSEFQCVFSNGDSWDDFINNNSYVFNHLALLPFASTINVNSSGFIQANTGEAYGYIYYDSAMTDKVHQYDYIIPGGTYYWKQTSPI